MAMNVQLVSTTNLNNPGYKQEVTAGAAHVTQTTLIAGEPGSGKTLAINRTAEATIIDGVAAVTLGGGIANDAVLDGILILANATAVTATIGGLYKRDAAGTEVAQALVLTGSTSVDTLFPFPAGMRNKAGALTITASVDEKVVALWNEAE